MGEGIINSNSEVDFRFIGFLINEIALPMKLRPDIVAAIVLQESNGNTFAWRWEEAFWEKHLKNAKREELAGFVPPAGSLPSLVDERLQRSCSYGLMQVLGDTARWCGKVTAPFIGVLHDPKFGIQIGSRVLQFYLAKSKGDYDRALKYYNGSWEYVTKINNIINNRQHLKFFEGE